MSSHLAITAAGMVSPVGLDLIQSCASVRAGIDRFQEFEDFECEPEELDWGESELLRGARVPTLSLDSARVPALLLWALQDIVRNAHLRRNQLDRLGLCVVLPESRPAADPSPSDAELEVLFQEEMRVHCAEMRAVRTGRTGWADAVQIANAWLKAGSFFGCVVVGVDSYHDQETLKWLDASGRLASRRNLDGFLPGEAGAAILLESEPAALARGVTPKALLSGPGCALEGQPQVSGDPSTAAGLTRAIEAALETAGKGSAPFSWVACDLNGERYRSQEWGNCIVRLRHALGEVEPLNTWHPADCLGDVGAASGVVLAALVARAFEKGYSPANECLIWTAGDDANRAAGVIENARMTEGT
jgi:3-oxoacyl-[acyl-carrier-protein] synthase-1